MAKRSDPPKKKKPIGGDSIYVFTHDPHGDDTFSKEFNRAGKDVLSRDYKNVNHVSVTNPDEFKKEVSKLPKGSHVMFMDHAGGKMFGLPSKEFAKELAGAEPELCIGGTCFGGTHATSEALNKYLPNTSLYLSDSNSP